ncbi:Pkhd1l1 [Symbiodinium sp. CCMP2592]|nr:Pkhd1l1 [Symbiodinium sp. CCMP2592]
MSDCPQVRPKELVGNEEEEEEEEEEENGEGDQQIDLNEAVATVTGVFILGGCEQDRQKDSLLLSDNHIGVALRFFRSRKDMSHRIFSHNVTVFGSTSASTCAASTDCRAYGAEDTLAAGCNSVIGGAYRRVGIMTHMINSLAKLCELGKPGNSCRPPTLPVKMCVMPWEHRIGTLGSRYSEAHWDGITFGHFSGSDCGKPSVAFTYNPTNIDASYPQFFSDVTWLPSVDIDARVYLGESSIRHNKVVMSGDLDGTNQIVLTDADGSLLSGAADGSLVTVYNPALAQQSCSEVGGSYYSCPNLPLRYLTWEAAGGPAHRVLSKFKAWRSSDRRATWSQGPMPAKGCIPDDPDQDRNWKIRPNDTYKLTMFTSPPKHHRLFWFNDNADEAIRLDIFLTQPFRLEVYVDGALLPEESFDTSQLDPPRLPELSDPHGSYAFDPHARRFYLVMKGGTFAGRPATTGGGYVLLRMLQVVQISMQLSVKLADFDGPNIVNNLATLLQIDTSRIKIVSVQTAAQVAGAGGRRLQADGVDLTFQIVEESSEPIPGEAENATSGNESDDSFDFSGDSLAKLTPLVQVLQNASETGALSQALNTGVVVRSIETTDPTLPAAVESTTTTSATATTTTTTTGTATSTTTSSTTVTVTDTSTQTSTRTTSHTTTTATTSITTQTGTTSRTATRTTTGTTSTFTQSTTTTLTATTVTTTPDVADGATWTATSTTSWSTTSATHTETTTWSTTRTVTSTTTYTATHTETTTWSTTHTVTDTTTYTATYTSTDTITDTTTGTATTTRTETTKTSTHTTSVSVTGSSTSSPSTADAETSTTAVATTAQASTAGASTSPSEVETFTSTWSDTSVSTSEELLLATSSNFSSNGSLSETLAPEGDLEGPQFAVAALIPAEPLDGVAFSVAIGSAAGVAFGVATVSALLIYRGWRTPPVRLDRVQPLTAVVPVAWEPARKLP